MNSSASEGSATTTAIPKTTSSAVSVSLAPAPSSMVSVSGNKVGELRGAPAPDHGDHRRDREWADAALRAAPEQYECAEPAGQRDERERQTLASQAVVDAAGVVAQHEYPGDREHAGHERGGERPGSDGIPVQKCAHGDRRFQP